MSDMCNGLPAHWVNPERTVLVSRHPDGSLSVALREDPDAIWGPPITVHREGLHTRVPASDNASQEGTSNAH